MPNDNFSSDFYERWQHLLSDIEMDEVPLRFVKQVIVNLENAEPVVFDLIELQKKITVSEIEKRLQKFLDKNSEKVEGVDFLLNVHAVADTVTKKVSKILGND